MNKILELIYTDEEIREHSVALSFDKAKLQAIIDKMRAVDDEFNKLDEDERDEWEMPSDYPLKLIIDFDDLYLNLFDVDIDYAEYADYMKIREREVI